MAAMQLSFESLGIACQPTLLAEGWWGKEVSGQKREGRKQGEKRGATRRNAGSWGDARSGRNRI